MDFIINTLLIILILAIAICVTVITAMTVNANKRLLGKILPGDKPEDAMWHDKKRNWCGLPLSFTYYSCTNERILVRKGLLSTTEDEVRLYRVLDVRLKETLIDKLFKIGNVEVKSSDKTLGNFTLVKIKHPRTVKEFIVNHVENARDRKRVTGREYMTDTEGEDIEFGADDL